MAAALASLLALLAAHGHGTSPLDCVCGRIYNQTAGDVWADAVTDGEAEIWDNYCEFSDSWLLERCETLEQSATMLPAAAQLAPWSWDYGPPPYGDGLSCGECACVALAVVRALTWEETEELPCHMADAITDYYSAQGLNDTNWTVETLAEDHQKLSQLLHGARSIARTTDMVYRCQRLTNRIIEHSPSKLTSVLKERSMYWRRIARLLPLLATHISQLFIPLAFKHMRNNTNGQQLHGWIKNMEHVRDMLHTKLRGVQHDAQLLSEQPANYMVEEDKDKPGNYKIRRPLLSNALLDYQEDLLSFRCDFGALCEQQLPHAAQVFGLADALYALYRNFFPYWITVIKVGNITDEEWQVKDQSNTTVWVDTGCLQLLAETVDEPRCPLEELPLEASRRRRQCREQLWQDLVERSPRPPVTSYLAYNERAAVSLCLLAWMAANSRGVCQDVPFSVLQSVHDAMCYFDSPHNQTCLQSNTTDAICSVSRAILLLKCREFSSFNPPKTCFIHFYTTGNYTETQDATWVEGQFKVVGQPTQTTLRYKESLNSATLEYTDFKVDTLKPLAYSFIVMNVFFRLLTATVYLWLPHLGNLPGKILLSFQLTGLAQLLCSEVLYRMVGFPDLSTAVLVDSSLTLLGCLWLNSFSYQMYACVRDLRLPNHLTPAEANMVFRRQQKWTLISWAIVSTTCAALEKSSKYYRMHSRITLIAAISSSVAFNLILLASIAFIYRRNKKSMTRLNVICEDKTFSKKQLTFMSVNTIILSGICVIIRIGYHQVEGIAQYVYYMHIATMLQGPVLFVFFLGNGTTLPVLRNRLLALWRPEVYTLGRELCSAAKQNLARRRDDPPLAAETSL